MVCFVRPGVKHKIVEDVQFGSFYHVLSVLWAACWQPILDQGRPFTIAGGPRNAVQAFSEVF
jgi:hypothetical protein